MSFYFVRILLLKKVRWRPTIFNYLTICTFINLSTCHVYTCIAPIPHHFYVLQGKGGKGLVFKKTKKHNIVDNKYALKCQIMFSKYNWLSPMQIIIEFIVSQAPIIREGAWDPALIFFICQDFLDDSTPSPSHTHTHRIHFQNDTRYLFQVTRSILNHESLLLKVHGQAFDYLGDKCFRSLQCRI